MKKCFVLKNAFYFCGFYGYVKGFGYFHIQGNASNKHIKPLSFEALNVISMYVYLCTGALLCTIMELNDD